MPFGIIVFFRSPVFSIAMFYLPGYWRQASAVVPPVRQNARCGLGRRPSFLSGVSHDVYHSFPTRFLRRRFPAYRLNLYL